MGRNDDGSVLITGLGLDPEETGASATDVNDFGEITVNTRDSSWRTTDGRHIRPAWFLPEVGGDRVELDMVTPSAEAFAISNNGDIVGVDDAGVVWRADTEFGYVRVELGAFNPSDIADDSTGTMAGFQAPYRGYGSGSPAIAWFNASQELVAQTLTFKPSGLTAAGNATAISHDGEWVAGWVTLGGREEAFVWTASEGIMLLGTLGGENSMALGVNDSGQVVGWSETGDRKHPQAAFLWEPEAGPMRDLNAVAATGGKLHLIEATAVNNAGHIVGYMEIAAKWSVEEHAFTLIRNLQEN